MEQKTLKRPRIGAQKVASFKMATTFYNFDVNFNQVVKDETYRLPAGAKIKGTYCVE